jgi:hypothetical protein
MPEITAERLNGYQQRTFRLQSDLRLQSKEDGLEFVNERGFVHFWPIKGLPFLIFGWP